MSGLSDYYATLGVHPLADEEVIAAAYRALAKKYHPDTAGAGSAARFVEVQEAYEVLRDPERRAAYDEAIAADAFSSSQDVTEDTDQAYEPHGGSTGHPSQAPSPSQSTVPRKPIGLALGLGALAIATVVYLVKVDKDLTGNVATEARGLNGIPEVDQPAPRDLAAAEGQSGERGDGSDPLASLKRGLVEEFGAEDVPIIRHSEAPPATTEPGGFPAQEYMQPPLPPSNVDGDVTLSENAPKVSLVEPGAVVGETSKKSFTGRVIGYGEVEEPARRKQIYDRIEEEGVSLLPPLPQAEEDQQPDRTRKRDLPELDSGPEVFEIPVYMEPPIPPSKVDGYLKELPAPSLPYQGAIPEVIEPRTVIVVRLADTQPAPELTPALPDQSAQPVIVVPRSRPDNAPLPLPLADEQG